MAKIITLNNLITLLKQFQEAHPQLNDFGFGDFADIGTSRQMKFPYMWVNVAPSTVAYNENKLIIPIMSFNIAIMDQANNQANIEKANGYESNNVAEILSDTHQILLDLIGEISRNFGKYGIVIDGDLSYEPMVDETDDSSNGWLLNITLRMQYSNCDIPR